MPPRVCVLGSINMDVVVRVGRFPEPGETVAGTACDLVPGGKGANQAVAVAKMGVPVDLVGALGLDEFGKILRDYLADSAVNLDAVAEVDGPSGTAVVAVDADGNNQIVVVPGSNGRIAADAVASYLSRHGDSVRYLLSQFEVPIDLVADAFVAAKARGTTTVLNPSPMRPLPPALLAATDLIVLNEVELAQAAGERVTTPEEAAGVASRWSRHVGGKTVVVTLGGQGLVAVVDGRVIRQSAKPVRRVVDTTGAGDCFCGTLVAFLYHGRPLVDSLHLAQEAAARSVERPGASPSFPRAEELARGA
jgi:ribokinase